MDLAGGRERSRTAAANARYKVTRLLYTVRNRRGCGRTPGFQLPDSRFLCMIRFLADVRHLGYQGPEYAAFASNLTAELATLTIYFLLYSLSSRSRKDHERSPPGGTGFASHRRTSLTLSAAALVGSRARCVWPFHPPRVIHIPRDGT